MAAPANPEQSFRKTLPASSNADEDIGEVDTKYIQRRVWLVKIPQFLADAWQKAGQDAELGRVRIMKKSPSNPHTEITVSLTGPTSIGLPKEYNLELMEVQHPTYIISEELAGGALTMEGTVIHRCDLKPSLQDDYHHLLKTRMQKAQERTRSVQTTTERELPPKTLFSRIVTTVPGAAPPKKVRRASSPSVYEKKRVRSEKEEVIDRLFKLFEQKEYWTLNELKDATEQPVQYLKEILNELCVYNKRGPHKSTYELKPEYKSGAKPANFRIIDLAGKQEQPSQPTTMEF